MVNPLKAMFPRLTDAAFRVTSERDQAYNCIAWAAGVTHQRWWPLENPDEAYWPDGITRERTIEAFRSAFATLEYTVCSGDGIEPDLEKVALFADTDELPTHAARQLAKGRWTSKLGKAEDIEHELRDLEGDFYGTVVLLMGRPAR
jgi:hypothetical protein